MLKDEEIYNIFNTEKLLNRRQGVTLSNTSGLAGIAYWINEHYDLMGSQEYTKDDELVVQLKDWIDVLYEDGRTTSLSNGELEDKIAELSDDELLKKEKK